MKAPRSMHAQMASLELTTHRGTQGTVQASINFFLQVFRYSQFLRHTPRITEQK